MSNVQMDLDVKFGARVSNENYILITLSDEFIRNDNGNIVCSILVGGVETTKTC
jgi:hypothetical protein